MFSFSFSASDQQFQIHIQHLISSPSSFPSAASLKRRWGTFPGLGTVQCVSRKEHRRKKQLSAPLVRDVKPFRRRFEMLPPWPHLQAAHFPLQFRLKPLRDAAVSSSTQKPQTESWENQWGWDHILRVSFHIWEGFSIKTPDTDNHHSWPASFRARLEARAGRSKALYFEELPVLWKEARNRPGESKRMGT